MRIAIKCTIGLSIALAVIIAASAGAPPSTTLAPSAPEVYQGAEATVLALERAWGQAYVTGDIAFVDKMLAPDWRGWTDTEESDKPHELAEFRAGHSKSLENIIDKARVRVYGDVAVVEARERVRYRDGSGEHWLTWHITDVLVHTGTQWQVVTSHQSTLPNP
jgi:ketosteroid isomerase-like protein